VIFKLQLLTCSFYVGLNIMLAVAIWMVINHWPFGIFFRGKYPFWSVGLKFAIFFGALWAISFFSAWCIVYFPIKAQISGIHG
jgi:hypothetical protein